MIPLSDMVSPFTLSPKAVLPLPIRRRLSPEKLVAAKAEFNKLLAKGIVRPYSSTWASPLHVAPKGKLNEIDHNSRSDPCYHLGSTDGAVVRALASHQCGQGFDSRAHRHMWVEFVVGSLLCSERFFSGYSGFPLPSKANISKFQLDLGMHGYL